MNDELKKIEIKRDGKNDERFKNLLATVATTSKEDVMKQEAKEKKRKKAKKP